MVRRVAPYVLNVGQAAPTPPAETASQ